VVDRIINEARGNPLALLELPRGERPVDLAGAFASPDRQTVSAMIEASFRHRIAQLPPDCRRLLLLAAAEPVGQLPLLREAAERLGLDLKAAAPAEAEGLVEFGRQVRFRHPLARSPFTWRRRLRNAGRLIGRSVRPPTASTISIGAHGTWRLPTRDPTRRWRKTSSARPIGRRRAGASRRRRRSSSSQRS
jgi:hypothetical protein